MIGDYPLPPNNPFVEDDVVERVYKEATTQDADNYSEDSDDYNLTAQILLPQGREMTKPKVTGRKRDADGLPMGRRNRNPLLDSGLYEVKFPDRSTDAFSANKIAENMVSQVDDKGHISSILDNEPMARTVEGQRFFRRSER